MSDENRLPDDADVIQPRTVIEPIPQVESVVNQTVVPDAVIEPAPLPAKAEEEDDILYQESPVEEAAEAAEPQGDDEDAISVDNTVDDDLDSGDGDVRYPDDKIDFRGEDPEKLGELLVADLNELGADGLDARVRSVGSWENIVFRAIREHNFEEGRIQEAIAALSPEDRKELSSRYRDSDGKTRLRTSALIGRGPSAGETRSLSGDEAVLAFENLGTNNGGGYRIPLYNSGITIDVIVPTGNDIQTMLTNCLTVDRELGSSSGAHYFTYADQMYKTQILNFIQPLIVNSSYSDWRKNGKLWSVIKLPDLMAIVMTIAAICYKDGFDDFMTKCTRPVTEENPQLCKHTESITANLFEMIVTRFAAMSKESIDFMIAARLGNAKNSLTQIAQYQAGLGLEGERITFGDLTFTLRVPTLAEHLDAGAKFISDIVNEIEGDNNEGRYEQFAFRYIRTFLPWIATVERRGPQGEIIKTSEARVIIRELEKLDDKDPEDKLRNALRGYVNKVQLTYVGYPITECPACGYVGDTPSGMWTFDPFSAFFTLAFLYLRRDV